MKAILKNIRISSKKVNLVAGLVRGMNVREAIDFLRHVPKRASKEMRETIMSAAANAEHNFKQKRADLVIKSIVVNEGTTFKRFNPVSRGRAHPILKRTSHITVEVGVGAPAQETAPAKKQATVAKTPAKTTKAPAAKKY